MTETVETAEIAVKEYVARFRDVETFAECCRQCPNYGNLWTCPPFGYSTDDVLSRWKTALVVALNIVMDKPGISLSEAWPAVRPVRVRLERRLLELEKEWGGTAFGFSGECLHCRECARKSGQPCRHPELVRPALEAYGFDVGKTVRELFGRELSWGSRGRMPARLTLVGALFHSRGAGEIGFEDIRN